MRFPESVISNSSSLKDVRILNTRPAKFSQYLVQQIEQRGGKVVCLPTIKIEFTANPQEIARILAPADSFHWAIFSSRNAVLSVFDCMKSIGLRWPSHLKCAAVGPKTAEAVKQAFEQDQVLSPTRRYGAQGLLDLSEMQDVKSSKIVLFDGGKGTGLLMRELPGRCKEVSHQIVYSRNLPNVDIEPIAVLVHDRSIHFVVITSVNGGSNLFQLLGTRISNELKRSTFIAYSLRIAEYLKQQGCSNVLVPELASDDAVVELVEKYCI